MCGRYAVGASASDLGAEFGPLNDKITSWHPLWSVAPTNDVPIVHEQHDGRALELARWDWPKPSTMRSRGPIINARIEKLDGSFWARAFRRARCIVPLTGYYEWTGAKGDKQPHYLYSSTADEHPALLAAAGLTWTVEIAGDRQRVVVIVTRAARDAAGRVHDRMPAMLDQDLRSAWLDPTVLTDQEARTDLIDGLKTSSERLASSVVSHKVDRRVSSVQRIDPRDRTLIDPI